jgi:hypothetical protein
VVVKSTVSRVTLLASCVVVVSLGCQENPPDSTISQFDRPQDVALVCYDNSSKDTLPIDCCRTSGVSGNDNGECSVGLSSASLYAFVTQTTPGEVAVVDLAMRSIVDQDERIPYNSFIPVGGQPNDIKATFSGKHVYTANYETGDLSVINVLGDDSNPSVIESPVLRPAASISLSGGVENKIAASAARLVLSRFPLSNRDKFAFVTQPTLERLTVVRLNAGDDDDEYAEHCPHEKDGVGCVLGFLDVDGNADTSSKPWAVIASEINDSIYVGFSEMDDSEIPGVFEISSEILVQEALALDEPGPLSNNARVRKIDLGHTTRSLALEPELERWLYFIDNEEGEVHAKDISGISDINNPVVDVDVEGRARALTLTRFDEGMASDEDLEQYTFNGTFAVVSTTQAAIFVIDVEDLNADPAYPHNHEVRSSVDLTSDSEDLPHLEDPPAMLLGGDPVSDELARQVAFIDYEFDAGLDGDAGINDDGGADADLDAGPDEGEDAGADAGESKEFGCESGFKTEESLGIYFRCDPRESRQESWNISWQGSIGISGVGVIEHNRSFDDNGNELSCPNDPATGWGGIENKILRDEYTDFCAGGLNTGRYLPSNYVADDDDVGSSEPEYGGDLLIIKSAPTPQAGQEETCAQFGEPPYIFQIMGLDGDKNRIRFGPGNLANSEYCPNIGCFGQAVEYEIRAYKHWVINGSRSGIIHETDAIYDEATGRCVSEMASNSDSEFDGRTCRVWPGEPFENKYLKFSLIPGEKMKDGYLTLDEDDYDSTSDDSLISPSLNIGFTVVGGYKELGAIVGNNVTDILLTPDLKLILVDQDRNGLITFDMLDSFSAIGQPVN